MTFEAQGRTVLLAPRMRDHTSALLETLADAEHGWSDRLAPELEQLVPVLLARSQMATARQPGEPLERVDARFKVTRVGQSTFDLEGRLIDMRGREVARSASVFGLVDARSWERSSIPQWLNNRIQGAPQ